MSQIKTKFLTNNAVTNAKLAQVSALTIKGNNTGSTANTLDLTVTQVNTMLGDILANGTVAFTADQSLGSHKLTNVTDPSSAQDAATKNYVDTALAALNPADACYAASTTTIPGTYLNGIAGVGATFITTSTATFTSDGTTPPLNSRFLFKDQSTGFQNGIYLFTALPVSSVSGAVFTRALDYNTAGDMNTAGLIPIQNGTVNGLSSWQQTATITTVGSDALVFQRFTANPSLYLLKTNNLSDVASANTAFGNISPLTTKGDILSFSTINARLSVGSDTQVLTADSTQLLGVKWATPAGSSSIVENPQTGTSYTFVLTDAGKLVSLTNASSVTATIPTNATTAFPIGSVIQIISGGAGQVTIAPAGGVTINSYLGFTNIIGQYAEVTLYKTATNTWYLYGSLINNFIQATGGTITTNGNFKVHTFTSSGTFQITGGSGTVASLVVAGGGGSGAGNTLGYVAGAGGAGGLIYTTPGASLGAGSYTVTVGAGGAGGSINTNVNGSNGGNSQFNGQTAAVGGGGGGGGTGNAGSAGGSGGGGFGDGSSGGSGTGGQGNSGGAGAHGSHTNGGGGGGAGGAGTAADDGTNIAGNGGAGVSNSITGSAILYASGGGGGSANGTPGTASAGGGGAGGNGSSAGTAGTGGTGGGGGSSGSNAINGSSGGSGIVIVTYQFQ